MRIRCFVSKLVWLVAFMGLFMGVSKCGCNNYGKVKRVLPNQGSIAMDITPTELKGNQRTFIVTFLTKDCSKFQQSMPLAPYQLQVNFPENTQVYYSGDKRGEQILKRQEKINLAKLLSTQEISSSQVITCRVVPTSDLESLEIDFKLLKGADNEIQKGTVHWKQDASLSTIRIELGHNHVNSRIIYSLENKGADMLRDVKLRCTNVSTDEEGKRVVLNNQLTSLPIPQLAAGERIENRFIDIDFKNAQQATFKFEVIDQQHRVLATREERFTSNVIASVAGNEAFQEVVEELKKDSKEIDMNKVKRLLDQPGFSINQLVIDKTEDDQCHIESTLVTKAVDLGNLELVKLLLGKGADVGKRFKYKKLYNICEARLNTLSGNALDATIVRDDKDMMQTLLEASANINDLRPKSGPWDICI